MSKELTFEQKVMRAQFCGAGGIFGAGSRIELYETLSIFLSNGVQLVDALREMYLAESKDGKKPKAVNAVVLQDCMMAYASGRSLSQALTPWVTDQETQLIMAGERSGDMAPALEDAVKFIEAKKTIVGSVIGGMAYPIVLFIMVTVLLWQITHNLVPQFERLLPSDEWTGAAALLKMISDFVMGYGLYTLVATGFLIVFVFWAMPNLDKTKVRNYLDKIPPFSIYRMLHGSTFLLNIAVLLKAGMRLQEILEIMGRVGSPWLRERINATLIGINQGYNLGDSLENSGYDFPDDRSIRFLKILSNQEGFEVRLSNFAERWLEKSVQNIKNSTGIILGLGICAAGILILLILLGVMSIQSLVQTSLG